jgi:ankyrin repeat protein
MKKAALLFGSFLTVVFAFQSTSQTQTAFTSQIAARGVATLDSAVPSNDPPEPAEQPNTAVMVEAADLRAASAKAIKLIQQSQAVWSQKESCASCHHQLIPEIPINIAGKRGIPFDENFARQTTLNTFGFLKDLDGIVQGYDYIDVLFDGWALYSAEVAGIRPSLSTSASAQFIASRQLADGSWTTVDTRPPQAFGTFTTTAVCARAVKTYLPEHLAKERESRIQKARTWLLNAQPRTTDDLTFRLFGLHWTGADEKVVKVTAQKLLAEQRSDGGWSQLPGMQSDAYSTGQALTALQECVGIPGNDPAYQRGLQFLLNTQQPDGSWHVSSRLHPPAPVSPPYFETGFPYKHDQFISAMGTGWAAAAILRALPANSTDKTGQRILEIAPAEQPRLVQVALNGSAAELRKLLDAGVKADARSTGGSTALMFAARDIEKVKLLVERGADVNARAATGITVLTVAARYRGNSDVVRFLLKKGAKPNAETGVEIRNSATPIFLAVMAGDVETIGLLIDAGAKINDRMNILGRFLQSPLIYSTLGDRPVAELLLTKGADPNEVDNDKISVLSWAAIANQSKLAQLLLAKGAKVNHVDNNGMTPLLYAASIDFGDTEIVEKLIGAGADVSAKNKQGLTALDLAKTYHHQRIADLLAKKTAVLSGKK